MTTDQIQKTNKILLPPVLRENVLEKQLVSRKTPHLNLKALHTKAEDGHTRVGIGSALQRLRSRQSEPKTNQNSHARVQRRKSLTP